jgi:hypothetical protein
VDRPIEYEPGTASVQELRGELEAFWLELAKSDELRREVTQAGLDPEKVQQLDPARDIKVEKEGEGFAPVAIIIVFAPAANHILSSLWDEVAVPWIRRRRGADAIGQKKGPH